MIQLSQSTKSLRLRRQNLGGTSSSVASDSSLTFASATAHPLLDVSYSGTLELAPSLGLVGPAMVFCTLMGKYLMGLQGESWVSSVGCSLLLSRLGGSPGSARKRGPSIGCICSSGVAGQACFQLAGDVLAGVCFVTSHNTHVTLLTNLSQF